MTAGFSLHFLNAENCENMTKHLCHGLTLWGLGGILDIMENVYFGR
jgi:hypothetical protein